MTLGHKCTWADYIVFTWACTDCSYMCSVMNWECPVTLQLRKPGPPGFNSLNGILQCLQFVWTLQSNMYNVVGQEYIGNWITSHLVVMLAVCYMSTKKYCWIRNTCQRLMKQCIYIRTYAVNWMKPLKNKVHKFLSVPLVSTVLCIRGDGLSQGQYHVTRGILGLQGNASFAIHPEKGWLVVEQALWEIIL